MYIVLIVCCCGSGAVYGYVRYYSSDTLTFVPLAAVASVLGFVAYYINKATGFDDVTGWTWKALSGVASPGAVVQKCISHIDPFLNLLLVLGSTIIMFMVAAIGFIAWVAVPIGGLVAAAGGVKFALSREESILLLGVKAMTAGFGVVLMAGLGLRLVHYLSGASC